jgi:hypothetical protein
MARRILAALLFAVLAAAGQAEPGAAWRGPGWYHAVESAAGLQLRSGPHPTELACKKAMNSGAPAERCVELRAAP